MTPEGYETRAQLQAKVEQQARELAEKDRALAELLRATHERLTALESAAPSSPVLSDADLARLRAARQELQELRPGASRVLETPAGPIPKFVPYNGSVRAKVDCTSPGSGAYRNKGDIFDVDLKVLWSDDPFEPVTVTGHDAEVTDEHGVVQGSNFIIDKIERRTDIAVIDYRFRQIENTSNVMARAM